MAGLLGRKGSLHLSPSSPLPRSSAPSRATPPPAATLPAAAPKKMLGRVAAGLRGAARRGAGWPAPHPAPAAAPPRDVRAYAKRAAAGAKPLLAADAELPEGDHWKDVQRWVVFSDLHVSRSTLQTCVETLRTVLKEARQRDAGVLFLGDFWHVRGAIPVQPLNTILEEFRTWDRPTLMIPGNHDQVTAGGHVHALTPIGEASDFVHVFDRPAVFLGALWLPYRRNQGELVEAIEAAGPVQAIFAHLDIVGAHVNETFQAREGMLPELFPPHMPTYTGHYHKPQVVPGTRIQYVGSPYQVSFSESGQEKHLLVLGSDWEEEARVHIRVGPRRYVVDSAEPAAELPSDLRPGDMVRWKVPSMDPTADLKKKKGATAMEVAARSLAASLDSQGVVLEVLQPPPRAPPRIADADTLGTLGLFEAYVGAAGMSSEARRGGLEILHSLDVPGRTLDLPLADVVLGKVVLEGYGPFLNETEYEMGARSVRVVTGRNQDDTGSDSNGAGKTTLVMAPQWALTGSSDPRIGEGGGHRTLSASDVVSDAATEARVRLEGTVNGEPFAVERCVNKRGTKYLRFEVGGEDLTCQETKLTQEVIDARLRPATLMRAAFFGQHAASALLDAGDRDFKEELGQLIDMDVWVAAKDAAREALSALAAETNTLEARLQVREQSMAGLAGQLAETESRTQAWEAENRLACEREAGELEGMERELQAAVARCDRARAHLEGGVAAGRARAAAAAHTAAPPSPSTPSPMPDAIPAEVVVLRAEQEAAQEFLGRAQVALARAEAAHEGLVGRLEEYGAMSEGVCGKCLQPIDSETHQKNLGELAAEAEEAGEAREAEAGALGGAREGLAAASAKLRAAEQAAREAAARAQRAAAEEAQRRLAEQQHAVRLEQAALHAESALFRAEDVLRWAEGELAEAALGDSSSSALGDSSSSAPPQAPGIPSPGEGGGMDWGRLSDAEVEVAVRELGQRAKEMTAGVEERLRSVDRRRGEVGAVSGRQNPFRSELVRLQQMCEEAEEEAGRDARALERVRGEAGWLKEVDGAFSRSGIQSFAIEGALGELQRRVGDYLHELSGGALGLTLSASRAKKRGGGTVEKIDKTVHVQTADGRQLPRTLWQLSGGERRRVALALALAYSEFALERRRLRCNLIVLDEVLQHLDAEGCTRLVRLLKGLPHSTVLLVSQESSFVANHFSSVDYVCKQNGSSTIEQG